MRSESENREHLFSYVVFSMIDLAEVAVLASLASQPVNLSITCLVRAHTQQFMENNFF